MKSIYFLNRITPLLIPVFLISCDNTPVLRGIYAEENWDHDGILFLTESANVGNIEDDSLEYYLYRDEKKLAMDSIGYSVDKDGNEEGPLADSGFVPVDTLYKRKMVFKNYGEIFRNREIVIYNIYRSSNEAHGRSHRFYLRTFDLNRNLIDTLSFAVWEDDNDIYFSGELLSDLKIRRIYKKKDDGINFQITKEGRFLRDL